jgi:hypothetical protein
MLPLRANEDETSAHREFRLEGAEGLISQMPMPDTARIDPEAGAYRNGSRRPTVVTAAASTSPELSAGARRRHFTAQDKLRILAETDRAGRQAGLAPSCVARTFIRRPSLTGAGSATWARSAHWSPANAVRRPVMPTHFRRSCQSPPGECASHAVPDACRSHHRDPKRLLLCWASR